MSTVGYGDIVCSTSIGRIFQILFLGVGLVSPNNNNYINKQKKLKSVLGFVLWATNQLFDNNSTLDSIKI